jgi:hypothetical protein
MFFHFMIIIYAWIKLYNFAKFIGFLLNLFKILKLKGALEKKISLYK